MLQMLPPKEELGPATADYAVSLLHPLSPQKLLNYDSLWLPGMSGSEDLAEIMYSVYTSKLEADTSRRTTSMFRHIFCRRIQRVSACGGLGRDQGACGVCGKRIGGGHGETGLPPDNYKMIGTNNNVFVYGRKFDFAQAEGGEGTKIADLDALKEEGRTGDVLADNDGEFDKVNEMWKRHSPRARRNLPQDARESAEKENVTPEEDRTRPESVIPIRRILVCTGGAPGATWARRSASCCWPQCTPVAY
eukprot:GSA120T00018388001.1